MSYRVSEVFYSLQGEGQRKGTANVFVRFFGCNLECKKATHGFDCDTPIPDTAPDYTLEQLVREVAEEWGDREYSRRSVVLTGGEPLLQVDEELIAALGYHGFFVALETNGTLAIPSGIDYIACSPKRGEAFVPQRVDELRYVIGPGGHLPPIPPCPADHHFLSPAHVGRSVDNVCLARCVQFCEENPMWRLSTQDHKLWGIP